jgi:hypothetical protein
MSLMSQTTAEGAVEPASVAPVWGELRYSGELLRLLADGALRNPRRRDDAPPVLLLPREDLHAPLPDGIHAVAIHSRSDGIVDWQACVDPYAKAVEVHSSHCGMSVHPEVYRVLELVLDGQQEAAWNG